jgi:hypothetical protein
MQQNNITQAFLKTRNNDSNELVAIKLLSKTTTNEAWSCNLSLSSIFRKQKKIEMKFT